MPLSNYAVHLAMDGLLGGQSITPAATLYYAALDTLPSASDTGTTIATYEPAGGSYARVAVTNNGTNWSAASARVKSNATDVTYPTATASWGTIVAVAIVDAASGGNMLAYGSITSTAITSGDVLKHAAGDVDITFDGEISNYASNLILDVLFGGSTFTPPSTYVGATTVSVTNSMTGSTVTEPSGNAYARVAVTNNLTNWPAASLKAKSNGSAITFPQATGSWGTITSIFVADASSAGNVLIYTDITSTAITTGDTLSIASGNFDWTTS